MMILTYFAGRRVKKAIDIKIKQQASLTGEVRYKTYQFKVDTKIMLRKLQEGRKASVYSAVTRAKIVTQFPTDLSALSIKMCRQFILIKIMIIAWSL